MNPTRAQAIAYLLSKKAKPHLAMLYTPGKEVQVNVARDEGNLKDGFTQKGKQAYTDGVETWFSFRCPKNAWNEPVDNSGEQMSFSLMDRADAVGMTGWDFLDLRSYWVAFDFDSIVGHSERHQKKLADAELQRVRDLACAIPWIRVQKSTSGSGLHLYAFYAEPPSTKNHDEHAALARATLAQMSAVAGFDFVSKVDVCGSNIWAWARRSVNTDGFAIVKEATEKAPTPPNWRQHLKVVRGTRKKVLPEFAEDDAKSFDELAGQHQRTSLDDEHKKLVAWLNEHKCSGWWDSDHHMLVTHTVHLKNAHSALEMRGEFDTNSEGKDVDQPNAYAFPFRDGSWSVRRYTKGTAEHKSWEQDGQGWTRCWLNRDPDLRTASRARGGTETEQGAFSFPDLKAAAEVLKLLGGQVVVPDVVAPRPARVKPHKDGKKVIVEVDRQPSDRPDQMVGWYEEKGKWKAVVLADPKLGTEAEVGSLDQVLRHATTESRMDAGWFVCVKDGWNHEPIGNVQKVLAKLGYKKPEGDALMGASILNPWTIVSRPFQDEYPGDRLWNRSRAQYRYPKVDDPGPFPTWEMIYAHCGKGLDQALATNGWAQANEVRDGKTYLYYWVAAALQDPYQPTPYLFLWSEENDTGKSILHESLKLLIDGGVSETNLVFQRDEKFNGQMEGTVFCVLEEVNLKQNKGAYEKIKNWVTSPTITIRKMNIDPYSLPNTTHWIHTANPFEACPVFPGDTRIVVIHVPVIEPKDLIPKPELLERLKKEAPHFLSYLLSLEIPPSNSRLRVPVVDTGEKTALADGNRTLLEQFIMTSCFRVQGEVVAFTEFYDKFVEQLSPADRGEWQSKNKVSRGIPPYLPKGKIGMFSYVGNLSFSPPVEGAQVKPMLIARDGKLVPA